MTIAFLFESTNASRYQPTSTSSHRASVNKLHHDNQLSLPSLASRALGSTYMLTLYAHRCGRDMYFRYVD